MNRSNLRVITNALTEKITFDGRRATGVVFRLDGQTRTARAASEVVLCGGAVNSPNGIADVVGVGQAEHLVARGVPVGAPPAGRWAEPPRPLFRTA